MQTQVLRRSQLRHITGISLSTIDRLRKEGKFPEPILLTGAQAVGWLSETIFEWLASRQPKTSAARS